MNNINKVLEIRPKKQNKVPCPQNKAYNSIFKNAYGINTNNER